MPARSVLSIYTRLMIFVNRYLFVSSRASSVRGKETSLDFVITPASLFFLNHAPACLKRPVLIYLSLSPSFSLNLCLAERVVSKERSGV